MGPNGLDIPIKRRMHLPIPVQAAWLASVVRGYFAYYAVPTNSKAMSRFRFEVIRLWYRALKRRSQRTHLNWQRMWRITDRWLPRVESATTTPAPMAQREV